MADDSQLLLPEKTLSQLDIKEGMKLADFGCGHGHFTILAGLMVGKEGMVYAIDVRESALEVIRAKAQSGNASNIQTIRGNLEVWGGSQLDDNSMDWVLLHNILFQSELKADIIKEAKRVLKPGGRIAFMDWQPGTALAPKGAWLISREEAEKLFQSQGFKIEKELVLDQYHYGLVLRK